MSLSIWFTLLPKTPGYQLNMHLYLSVIAIEILY